MLEYFSYKKIKKHREEKAAKEKLDKGKEKEKLNEPEITKNEVAAESEARPEAVATPPQIISQPPDDNDDEDDNDVAIEGAPILDREDEKFLERLTSSDPSLNNDDGDEAPPPLPPRVKTPVIDIDSDTDSVSSKEEGKDGESKGKGKETSKDAKGKEHSKSKSDSKHKRFTFTTNFLRRGKHHPENLSVPQGSTSGAEGNIPHENSDLARVLDDLDLSAKNNRAFSLSAESAAMARRFTQVLKDLVNGVPTAYGDLVSLLDDRDGLLARNFEKLPSSLKKLVAQLPEKLTSSLAPELLAAAAEAQGLEATATGAGMKEAAKKFLTPSNLQELVTKPGALVGLLKGIVNALKTRFPAFVGTNVLWSLAVFLLLSMLWYCHKRGREVRLEREATEVAEAEAAKVEGEIEGPRVEEPPDDPMLGAPSSDAARDEPKTGEVKAS
ncbi:hypothetical protein GGR51DRAFT_337341 [Nemania sp. FL0031]|nr:hypothetical protein GGR51DRAFT_337341 [Nemania sp. FL0031]